MKKFYFLFLLFPLAVLAQNTYKPIIGKAVYLRSDSLLFSVNISETQVLDGGEYYPLQLNSILRTEEFQYQYCLKPGIAGPVLLEPKDRTDKNFILLNEFADTITFATDKGMNQSWLFYRKGVTKIQATVTDIQNESVAGEMDSVKTITLKVFENNQEVKNLFSGKSFRLSKNNGLVKLFDIYSFPFDTVVYNLCGFPDQKRGILPLTAGEIYDYEVGDEFHYSSLIQYSFPTWEEGLIKRKVLEKKVEGFNISYLISEKTARKYHSDSPVQITVDSGSHWEIYDMREMGEGSFDFVSQEGENFKPFFYSDYFKNGKHWKKCSNLYSHLNENDRCLEELVLGGTLSSFYYYSAGFGLEAESHEGLALIYWKKGEQERGTPADLGLITSSVRENLETKVTVGPNPASGYFEILGITGVAEVEVKDMLGNIVLQSEAAAGSVVDLSSIPSAVYNVKISAGGKHYHCKLLKN